MSTRALAAHQGEAHAGKIGTKANVNEASSSNAANHKRKRDATEDGPADAGDEQDPKRVSPSQGEPTTTDHALADAEGMSDQAVGSYLSAHNASTTGAASNDEGRSTDFEGMADQAGETPSNQQNGDSTDATSTAAAALAGIYPTMTVPQPTDIAFANTASGGDNERNMDSSFMSENDGPNSTGNTQYDLETLAREGHQQSGRELSMSAQKPAVGSDEWHRVRRDNHKEVERRRRETINEGINELAKIVPGCEKNKGSILQRAVSFITQLKENEAQNIEKWTLEKLLTEQAIAELSASVDKLKNECERAWREAETWKKTCQAAGLTPKGEEGTTGGEGDKEK
ncbi:MAG: basic helix-loop-helix protein [Caeruleum heppii]|nr:MAG: basic helix-loop-helix protein [Caeruleum heppii]